MDVTYFALGKKAAVEIVEAVGTPLNGVSKANGNLPAAAFQGYAAPTTSEATAHTHVGSGSGESRLPRTAGSSDLAATALDLIAHPVAFA